jgi:hypothetical protein
MHAMCVHQDIASDVCVSTLAGALQRIAAHSMQGCAVRSVHAYAMHRRCVAGVKVDASHARICGDVAVAVCAATCDAQASWCYVHVILVCACVVPSNPCVL